MTSRLAEAHSIIYVRELPPNPRPADVHHTDGWLQETAIACAHDWAELNGVEITPNPCAETKDGHREAGCWWVVDIGKGVDDDPHAGPNRGSLFDNLTWTWSARWEHWRGWFESMRIAAGARGGVLRAGNAEVLFRDVNPEVVSALQDPSWGDDVDVVVDGDNHVVAMHPREDTPLARGGIRFEDVAGNPDPREVVITPFITDGPGLAGPSGIPHFTLSAPPGFLPPGDYTITRTRIPGPDVDAVHDAAWEGDDEDDFGITTGE